MFTTYDKYQEVLIELPRTHKLGEYVDLHNILTLFFSNNFNLSVGTQEKQEQKIFSQHVQN